MRRKDEIQCTYPFISFLHTHTHTHTHTCMHTYTHTQPKLVVEALYDCDPDHKDELGFREGDKIVVTKKLNKDWWVSQAQSRRNCHNLAS